MPPAATISFSSFTWWAAARSTSSALSISDWMSISPSRQSSKLVLEDELERADRGGVGDLARVVQVVRVRRDLVRDQHPVDADQLLDRQLGRLGLGHRVDEGHELVVGGSVSRSGFISRSSGRRLCHSSACQAWW